MTVPLGLPIKFGDFSFSRFSFIARTDTHTDRITKSCTDAAKRLTHATVIGVSNNDKMIMIDDDTYFSYKIV